MPSPPTDRPDAEVTPAPCPSPGLTVLYDGACPLCTREIAWYQRRQSNETIAWVDLTRCDNASLPDGVARAQALARFHVIDASGQAQTGQRPLRDSGHAIRGCAAWRGWHSDQRSPSGWSGDTGASCPCAPELPDSFRRSSLDHPTRGGKTNAKPLDRAVLLIRPTSEPNKSQLPSRRRS